MQNYSNCRRVVTGNEIKFLPVQLTPLEEGDKAKRKTLLIPITSRLSVLPAILNKKTRNAGFYKFILFQNTLVTTV